MYNITFVIFRHSTTCLAYARAKYTHRHTRPWGIGAKSEVKAIGVLYSNSKSAVMVDGNLSDPFQINTGVLLGMFLHHSSLLCLSTT